MQRDVSTDPQQHYQGNIGADAPGILQPLANVQTDDVQYYCDAQQPQRCSQGVNLVVRQGGVTRPANVNRLYYSCRHQPKQIKALQNPLAPSCAKDTKNAAT